MKNLEEAWGLSLFDRSLKTPALTQTGLALVGEAQALVTAYDDLPAKVSMRDALSGEVTLGAVPTTLTGLVPKGLAQLKIRHPSIRVRIVPGLTNQLLLQLERGQIDAAIISRPEIVPQAFSFSEIVTEDLVLLTAASTEDLPPDALLRSKPFIRFTRDAVVGRQIEAWLQRRGIEVTDAMELEGLEAISSMVAAELGVSIVPRSCLGEHEHLPLKRLPLEENGPKRIIGLVRHRATPRAKMCEAVREALLAALG